VHHEEYEVEELNEDGHRYIDSWSRYIDSSAVKRRRPREKGTGRTMLIKRFCVFLGLYSALFTSYTSCKKEEEDKVENEAVDVDLFGIQERFRASYIGKGCHLMTSGEALGSIVAATEENSIFQDILAFTLQQIGASKSAPHHKKKTVAVIPEPRIMFQTPCLDLDSFGNRLGFYIEARLCAREVGAHYVASEMTNTTNTSKASRDPFFLTLPSLVKHPHPVTTTKWTSDKKSQIEKIGEMERFCPCGIFCHENENALIFKSENFVMVRNLFLEALQKQLSFMQINLSFPMDFQVQKDERGDKLSKVSRISSLPKKRSGLLNQIWSFGSSIFYKNTLRKSESGTKASPAGVQSSSQYPLIPDVALHFRCGDNKFYGIMSFATYLERIPLHSRTVYILTEASHRKTDDRTRQHCNEIVSALKNYLLERLPKHTLVLLLRGQNIYLDLARLTFANVTICSVSTFCLWPAFANSNQVYYPTTNLIANATKPFIHRHFQWMDTTLMKHFTNVEIDKLLNYLQRDV